MRFVDWRPLGEESPEFKCFLGVTASFWKGDKWLHRAH